MLPRNWRRLADSKSNSSTRLPRTTTTRVSSGWVVSISILLAIDGVSCGTHGTSAARRGRWPRSPGDGGDAGWLWNEEGRAQLFATGDGHDRVNRLRGGAAAVKRLLVWPLEHCWGPDGRQHKLPYVFSCRRFVAIGVTDTFRSSRTKGLG